MSKPIAIPFEPEHFALLDMREHEKERVTLESLLNVANIGSVWTMVFNDVVLCITGWYPLWAGVIEVFVIPSRLIPRYRKVFWKYISNWLKCIKEDTHAHRLQTHSLADEATDSWMRHLGFTCEGTMFKYTSRQDNYRCWAMVT